MAHALVPLKDLVQAKSRLAGLLTASERRALAQAMAEDVLSVLCAHPQIDGVTLVSDDPGAGLLAAAYGARCWPEQQLAARGLNDLLAAATRRLVPEGHRRLLVLHADLPLLTAADISVVLQAQRQGGGLVIGCDRRGEGTNLLAFDPESPPAFSFGAGSCAAHRDAAVAVGCPVLVLRREGIASDIDEPADLARLLSHAGSVGGRTAALLGGGGLGARLRLALAGAAGEGIPDRGEWPRERAAGEDSEEWGI